MTVPIKLIRIFYYVVLSATGLYFIATLTLFNKLLQGGYDLLKAGILINILAILYITKTDRDFFISAKGLRIISVLSNVFGLILFILYLYEKYV